MKNFFFEYQKINNSSIYTIYRNFQNLILSFKYNKNDINIDKEENEDFFLFNNEEELYTNFDSQNININQINDNRNIDDINKINEKTNNDNIDNINKINDMKNIDNINEINDMKNFDNNNKINDMKNIDNITKYDNINNINNNNNINNINDINNYGNININIDNDLNNKNKQNNIIKNINSIIGPEDYEDYNKKEEEEIGKCLICLEEYEMANQGNYFLDCGCIIHEPCFDNYILNSINEGKVPIKCPYCNKQDINEIYIKDSLININKEELIEKFDKFNMNYFIMQHPDEVSCCPTPGCNYAFIYEEGDDHFECPLCDSEYCLKCKSKWHENQTCEDYRTNIALSKKEKKLDELFFDFVKGSKFKQCPYCRHWVEKNEGCNHIVCKCGNNFCYNCGGKMNENIYEHICGDEYQNINLRRQVKRINNNRIYNNNSYSGFEIKKKRGKHRKQRKKKK